MQNVAHASRCRNNGMFGSLLIGKSKKRQIDQRKKRIKYFFYSQLHLTTTQHHLYDQIAWKFQTNNRVYQNQQMKMNFEHFSNDRRSSAIFRSNLFFLFCSFLRINCERNGIDWFIKELIEFKRKWTNRELNSI